MIFLPTIIRFVRGKGGSNKTLSDGYVKAIRNGRKKLIKLHKEFEEREKIDLTKPMI